MIETKNAIIRKAWITNGDHGVLSAWLDLDYGGSGQGFGGYALYLPKDFTHHNPAGPNYAGHFIWRVMEVAGVEKWDQLAGKTVRVRCEHSKVHAIGHIVKDDWFEPSKELCRAREGSGLNASHEIIGGRVKEPKYPLTLSQQKRMVFLLQKYLKTVERRPGDRSHGWDLTKCDDETRKLMAQIGAEF